MQLPLSSKVGRLYLGVPRATWLAFALTITLFAGQSAYCAEKDALADSKLLQGEWKFVESVEEGKTYKAPTGVLWVFMGDKITVLLEGRKQHSGTVKLSASETPSTIEMKLKGETTANSDGDTFGIYKLEKDKLTVCVGVGSAKNRRPTTFTYSEDFPTSSVILERVK
jgi:uncharacterized protein (TIGR03067 family)